ncbi:hypothetical protein RB195_005704 [Necator americanus]|uniref:Uncharacterized protein n=1 Tax=Necator americanus TaxID=51031 RepID=A0ABR1BQN7_NECAM
MLLSRKAIGNFNILSTLYRSWRQPIDYAYTQLKCLWSTPTTKEAKLRVYLSAICPVMMYRSEAWAAPSMVMGM